MGLFDCPSTTTAATGSGDRYVRWGTTSRIDAVEAGKNRFGDDIIAIEMTNIHTFPDGMAPAKTSLGSPSEPLSNMISRKGAKDMYMGRFKAFLMSALNEADQRPSRRRSQQ